MEQLQDERHDEGGGDDADDASELHRLRRSTEDVPRLEILDDITGDTARAADNGRDPQHGCNAERSLDAHDHHEDRRDDQCR